MCYARVGMIIWLLFVATISHAKALSTLTLQDAILLAVREHPNVQSQELSYLLQRMQTGVLRADFYPRFAFQAEANMTHTGSTDQVMVNTQNFNVTPSVSWLSPIGTQVTLLSTNLQDTHFHPGLSLQVMQPLMRGFGTAVVEAALNDANDSETMARLRTLSVLQNTVTGVIHAYLQMVMAEETIHIDEEALKRAKQSVTQTRQFIRAGHKAGNELVTVEANVASASLQLANDKNTLSQARFTLLAAIGLDPTAKVHFSHLLLDPIIARYTWPSEPQVMQKALSNDIQYQIDQITLHGPLVRQALIAEDNTRWELNLSANASSGYGSGEGQDVRLNGIFSGVNQAQTVGLSLKVPIDDRHAKQAVASARIAIKQAELALQQEKWASQTKVMNAWYAVTSRKQALQFALDAERLQEKTYHLNYLKYCHGLIDSLSLQTAQQQFVLAEQAILHARIAYLEALVDLDNIMGQTLSTWHVPTRQT